MSEEKTTNKSQGGPAAGAGAAQSRDSTSSSPSSSRGGGGARSSGRGRSDNSGRGRSFGRGGRSGRGRSSHRGGGGGRGGAGAGAGRGGGGRQVSSTEKPTTNGIAAVTTASLAAAAAAADSPAQQQLSANNNSTKNSVDNAANASTTVHESNKNINPNHPRGGGGGRSGRGGAGRHQHGRGGPGRGSRGGGGGRNSTTPHHRGGGGGGGRGRGGGGRGRGGRGQRKQQHSEEHQHSGDDEAEENNDINENLRSTTTETLVENTPVIQEEKENTNDDDAAEPLLSSIVNENTTTTTTALLLGGLLLEENCQDTGMSPPSSAVIVTEAAITADFTTNITTNNNSNNAVRPVQHQQQQPPVLSLPTPPPCSKGKFMILSRPTAGQQQQQQMSSAAIAAAIVTPPPPAVTVVDYEKEAQHLSERLAAAALEDDDDDHLHHQHYHHHEGFPDGFVGEEKKDGALAEEETAAAAASAEKGQVNPDKKNKKPKKKKKSKKKEKENQDQLPEDVQPEVVPISTEDALQALPAQEVSITALTAVKIRRNESSASLTNNVEQTGPSKVAPKSMSKSSRSKKKKGLSSDSQANQKAAQRFNNDVRSCVERSNPDAMYELLHDKRHHNFALDHMVLETVMKAYVMAAMFEDALYCLRNCTLPGTLSTLQTERILTCLPQNLRNSSAYTAADMINALCIATEFDSPTARTYFLRIVRGIALEFLEEATSARDRICSSPCERLVRSGLCVVDARLKRGKKVTDLIVLPGDQLGVFVPDTMENRGIQAGDAVSILPYAGPYPMSAESLDRNMIEATVTNTNPMVLRLQDKTNANLHSMLTDPEVGNVYRIDKLANRMGFNRQLAAAVAIASPLPECKTRDTRRPCPELIQAITAMDENIDRVMKQQQEMDNKNNNRFFELTSTAALCSQAIPWNADEDNQDEDAIRAATRLALEKYNALEGLNASQRLAVEGATSNRLTLVQGPPGTGKTAVAIRILQHWARLASVAAAEKGDNPAPILATSDSNIAVDNLVEGCAAVGLRVVRLGRPEAIRPELLRYCIDRPPSSYGNNNSTNGNNSQNGDRGFGGGGGGAPNFKERMKQLKAAQVICCTCIGSGGDILDAMTFDRVLVDEATQATEPAVLVPLMRGCRQLVLVGDHCQLPPTVLSTRAEEEGHGVPLFSRMVACGVPPHLLDTQYRMHPRIAMFPSDLFYGGLLKNGVTPPERRPLAGFPWPAEEFPVAFIPVQGIEMDDGVSKYNEAEASVACETVAMLMAGGQCTVSDIAVVTPYAAQAKLIRRMTRRLQQNSGPPYIEVSSVDGFQGREKEAVVFSAVRSNDYGAIGFTSDWRRVNVSFTRARRALIVIGNDTTLRRGDPDTWGPWLAWADAHGLNTDKPGIPRGRYEPEQLRRVRGGTTAAEMLKDVLERQQAQLKSAEQQQQRAVKNAVGHIRADAEGANGGGVETVGGDGAANADGEGDGDNNKGLSLEEDLARAQMENAEGNWDDSDDDNDVGNLRHSASKTTLTSATSSNDLRSSDGATPSVDVWDL